MTVTASPSSPARELPAAQRRRAATGGAAGPALLSARLVLGAPVTPAPRAETRAATLTPASSGRNRGSVWIALVATYGKQTVTVMPYFIRAKPVPLELGTAAPTPAQEPVPWEVRGPFGTVDEANAEITRVTAEGGGLRLWEAIEAASAAEAQAKPPTPP